MNERATQDAKVERIENGWRLEVGRGDSSHYRDAQLDDYALLPRTKFPHQSLNPSTSLRASLSLRARASSAAIPGTWGFGLWNDPFGNAQGAPFGMSLGFGGNPFRLPALPNAVWFFHASPENYLSFQEPSAIGGFPLRGLRDTGEKNASVKLSGLTRPTQPPIAANGFLAQTFRSPKFHPLLILAGMVLPFSRKAARKLLSKVIAEDGIKLGVDVTQWHTYKFEWSQNRVISYVDELRVFESSVSPNPPLGVILWIDNQFAAFTPEGKIGFGVLENSEPAWIEICDLVIS